MDNLFSDPRDRIMAISNPVLPMPRHSDLPDLEIGRHRYLLAAGGVYLETRSRALRVAVRVMDASESSLPFGEVIPALTIGTDQHIPRELIAECVRLAKEAMPNEWAGVIVLQKGAFRLIVPPIIKATRASIGYSTEGIDPLDVVVDLHSHNSMPAFFSSQDDADDSANPTPVFVSMVLGRLDTDSPEMVSRVVVHRLSYDMNLNRMPLSNLSEPVAAQMAEEFS